MLAPLTAACAEVAQEEVEAAHSEIVENAAALDVPLHLAHRP